MATNTSTKTGGTFMWRLAGLVAAIFFGSMVWTAMQTPSPDMGLVLIERPRVTG